LRIASISLHINYGFILLEMTMIMNWLNGADGWEGKLQMTKMLKMTRELHVVFEIIKNIK